jgi:mannose-6-phosphate isomerase-like protein (cupin superfamily)
MLIFRIAALFVAMVASLWALGCLCDQISPEPKAPESFYPTVGQVIHSDAEGFTSRIIKVEGDSAWLELTMSPHAPGPPPHIHTRFAEDFIVAKGRLSLLVGDEVKTLGPGEHFKVEPGVVHRPFNSTDEEVIIRGPMTPEYAIPRDFVLFLSQIYGFVDESPRHKQAPDILFQIALLGPRHDSWSPRPSIAIQRVQYALLRPIARLLGYHAYDARFVPRSVSQPN